MHTAITQPAQDNLGTFLEGPLKVLKIIETKTKHREFRDLLIKLSLRVKFLLKCLQRFNTCKNLSYKCISKPLWWSTFSLKLESKTANSKYNLFGFERLCFHEVTFHHSYKKFNQSLVQKSEIHILN